MVGHNARAHFAEPQELLAIESLKSGSPGLTPVFIREIASAFREIFSNDWPEFAACFSCEALLPQRVKFSASEILRSEKSYVSSAELEGVTTLPFCPHCDRPMQFFIDLEVTVKKFSTKFYRDACITVIRSGGERVISGFTFASRCSLREAFEQEEWRHPYAYAAQQDPCYARSFSDFLQIVAPELQEILMRPVGPETPVLLWNCVAIRPDLRSRGYLSRMLDSFCSTLPEAQHELPILGQCEKRSRFCQLLRASGWRAIEGFLPAEQVLMCGPPGSFVLKLGAAGEAS